jgi:hypothetical protein
MVAYTALILTPFSGRDERLGLTVMFYRDHKWRGRPVKRKWLAEGRSIFDHDNVDTFGLIIRT